MTPYGHRWRTVTRPAILRRAGGRFTEDGKYAGAAKCEREGCGWCDCLPYGRSELDIAHLVIPLGEPGHDDETNLAALCRKHHRVHDMPSWCALFREYLQREKQRRVNEKDAARPILRLLDELQP